ncbi:MAG TPA: M23 family metallopeptidase [Longimicrobiales bacterium]|nr:M23 family metallopeptidase [Longimicrobiales bacterium]
MAVSRRVLVLAGIALIAVGGMFARPATERASARTETPLLDVVYAAPAERVTALQLRRGETLGGLLAGANLVENDLWNLLLAFREYADPRRLMAGSEVRIRYPADSSEPHAVEIGLNADTTLHLYRGVAGWEAELSVTPITYDTLYLEGVIGPGQSIYNAVMSDPSLDISDAEKDRLVHELAYVYMYKIDLGRDIQPGATYRVVYERETRPDGTARAQRVLVAELTNRGQSYPAIHFLVPGETEAGHYDLQGRSLRSGFRRYPFDRPRITSGFGTRYHPILGVYRAHQGIDFGAPTGTPVAATADGVVVTAGFDNGYGNHVVLRHQGGYTTLYAHLSRIETGVRPGTAIQEGQRIGYVGATGLATGPHLHYELRLNGRHLNPATAPLPTAPPLPEEHLAAFQLQAAERIALLQSIAGSLPVYADASEPPATVVAD